MKQGEYRAWLEGISEQYLIEAADYKPEKRAVPIWYTIGITSAVAAIAVCVGLIAYKGRNNNLIDQNAPANSDIAPAVTTTMTETTSLPATTTVSVSNTMLEAVTATSSQTQSTSKTTETTTQTSAKTVSEKKNYFGGQGDLRVLTASGNAAIISIAQDDAYYYLPNGENYKIPIEAVSSQNGGTLSYEHFDNPFSSGGRALSLFDEYGYYTQEKGVLYQVMDDGTEKKVADTGILRHNEDTKPDDNGTAKGIDMVPNFEKAFHVNDHVMYIQYTEVGSYMSENDTVFTGGYFYDLNTGKSTQIFPTVNDASYAQYFYYTGTDNYKMHDTVTASKVVGKDAVFFTLGGNLGVVVDLDMNYSKIDLDETEKLNNFYSVRGDVLYYASNGSDWCSYNYLTGEKETIRPKTVGQPNISMPLISASGESLWFFGDDNKFYTMKTDFTELNLVTDQYDPSFTTMYAATDDTAFFSPSHRKNGAPIPGYYPLVSVKKEGSNFIINVFSNEVSAGEN